MRYAVYCGNAVEEHFGMRTIWISLGIAHFTPPGNVHW